MPELKCIFIHTDLELCRKCNLLASIDARFRIRTRIRFHHP